MAEEAVSTQLICQRCNALLPEERRDYPWCECGWNLPPDPLTEMRGLALIAGRISRALGHFQNRLDARWLAHGPRQSASWVALSALMYAAGLAVLLGGIALYLGVIGLAIFGVIAIPQNCLLALIPLVISSSVLYLWRPYRPWIQKARIIDFEIHERVLETARGVAERLQTVPPVSVSFSRWSVANAGAVVRLLPWPHVERYVVVGLPLLSTLSITDLKVLLGHAMIRTEGLKGLLMPSIGKALVAIWKVFDRVSSGILDIAVYAFFVIIPVGLILYAPWFMFGKASVTAYASFVFMDVAIGAAVLLLITTCLVLLAATWYRRSILLADQVVARSFGRNALMQAESMGRLVSRTFAKDWPRLASDARWGKLPDGNLYTEFRRMWDTMTPALREKLLREVAAQYPALVYFESTLSDRADLLKGAPDQMTDNRPADSLLPSIREIGKDMTKSMFG